MIKLIKFKSVHYSEKSENKNEKLNFSLMI